MDVLAIAAALIVFGLVLSRMWKRM